MQRLGKIVFNILVIFYFIVCITNYEYIDFSRYKIVFDLTTIIFSFLVFISLVTYLKFEKKSRGILTPDKLFIILYVLLIYPGIIFLADGEKRIEIIISQSLSIMIFIFSIILIKSVNNLYKNNLKNEIIQKHMLANKEHNFIIVTSIVLSALGILIYISTGNFNRSDAFISLFNIVLEANTDSLGSVNDFRKNIYNQISFLDVLSNYISVIILPILGSFLVIEGKKINKQYLISIGFIVLTFAILFNFGSGSRLMTMKVFLYLFIIYSFLYNINFRILFKGGFTVFIILVLSTLLLGRGNKTYDSFGSILAQNSERALSRLTLVKGGSSLIVYDYYPKIEDFEMGRTILSSLSGLAQKENETIAMKMFSYVTHGKKGTAGPQTFADFYANFGFIGQIIGSLVLALIFGFVITIILKKKRFKSFDIAFICYITLLLGYMGYSETVSFKVGGMHIILILYIFYSIINAILNFKKNEAKKLYNL